MFSLSIHSLSLVSFINCSYFANTDLLHSQCLKCTVHQEAVRRAAAPLGCGLAGGSPVTASVSHDLSDKELKCRTASVDQDQGQRQWCVSDRPEAKQSDVKTGCLASGSGLRWRHICLHSCDTCTAVKPQHKISSQGRERAGPLLYNSSYWWRSSDS